MSHVEAEAAEAVRAADALVCNMGAIEDTGAMILAGKEANSLGIPVILDPVAAGGTSLRRETAKKLLKEVHFSVIRRGEEITAEIFEAHAAEIFDEAENRLHAQKAVMVTLMEDKH